MGFFCFIFYSNGYEVIYKLWESEIPTNSIAIMSSFDKFLAFKRKAAKLAKLTTQCDAIRAQIPDRIKLARDDFRKMKKDIGRAQEEFYLISVVIKLNPNGEIYNESLKRVEDKKQDFRDARAVFRNDIVTLKHKKHQVAKEINAL